MARLNSPLCAQKSLSIRESGIGTNSHLLWRKELLVRGTQCLDQETLFLVQVLFQAVNSIQHLRQQMNMTICLTESGHRLSRGICYSGLYSHDERVSCDRGDHLTSQGAQQSPAREDHKVVRGKGKGKLVRYVGGQDCCQPNGRP